MRILKKSQLLVVLLAACSLSFGGVERTKSEKSQLQFTISNEPEGWDASWEQSMQIAKPTHVAVFQLENVRHWNPWFRRITRVRGKSGGRLERVSFSERIDSTLTRQPGEFLLQIGRIGRAGMKFWLYATSEQQAREMAGVFIRYVKSLADVEVRRAEGQLEDYRKRITDIENEIPKIEEQRKTAEAELAECRKTTHYRNRDEAQKSILEWNNLLNVVEVDIIGIRAKLDMINQLKQKQTKTEEVDGRTFLSGGEPLWSLDKMRMAEEIELAGALARKNAALSYRKKALAFLDSAEKLGSLLEQLDAEGIRLRSARDNIPNIEKRLPQLRVDAKPVEVVDNEVEIHPVE
ncbi:MAG: hypothetical protein ACYTBJ_08570 [Planctomycetota bacterium]|jgi:hypothetical protein